MVTTFHCFYVSLFPTQHHTRAQLHQMEHEALLDDVGNSNAFGDRGQGNQSTLGTSTITLMRGKYPVIMPNAKFQKSSDVN